MKICVNLRNLRIKLRFLGLTLSLDPPSMAARLPSANAVTLTAASTYQDGDNLINYSL
jgi:hypothetical protein